MRRYLVRLAALSLLVLGGCSDTGGTVAKTDQTGTSPAVTSPAASPPAKRGQLARPAPQAGGGGMPSTKPID